MNVKVSQFASSGFTPNSLNQGLWILIWRWIEVLQTYYTITYYFEFERMKVYLNVVVGAASELYYWHKEIIYKITLLDRITTTTNRSYAVSFSTPVIT